MLGGFIMSLKSIIKEYCPLSLLRQLMYMRLAGRMCLSFLSEPQRRRRARRIIAEAEKYLPYYQDDLSREILRMREEYLMTNDEAIFFKISSRMNGKNISLLQIFSQQENIPASCFSTMKRKQRRTRKAENIAVKMRLGRKIQAIEFPGLC